VIRLAQLFLVLAAGGLWVASRLAWVSVRSSDGLGQPRTSTLSGAEWSNALLPLAVLLLATAVAALAVRGWPLRVVAVLTALACLVMGYLGVSLIVMPDVGPRGAELAGVPVATLVGADRQIGGSVVTLLSAVCVLAAAVLLMRAARSGAAVPARYAVPGARPDDEVEAVSERGLWDALDEGRDPTA